jgi:methionyl-tRNA formyltransferase
MLPQVVWDMPPMGTINLHGSLLPDYRGAAPINRAIMDGAPITGVTTFFLQQAIDTGNIIYQEKIPIADNETAGELHDRMMQVGAFLILKTVNAIKAGNAPSVPQNMLGEHPLAPKIFKEDCLIDWQQPLDVIYNHVRGLSPYPAAFAMLDGKVFKIYKAEKEFGPVNHHRGEFVTDNRSYLKVAAADGYLVLTEVQIEGKKKMTVKEFLNGYRF